MKNVSDILTGGRTQACCWRFCPSHLTTTTLALQCPLERSSIRAVTAWLRAAIKQRLETTPELPQELRLGVPGEVGGAREIRRAREGRYFSAACLPSLLLSFFSLHFALASGPSLLFFSRAFFRPHPLEESSRKDQDSIAAAINYSCCIGWLSAE